MIASLLSLIRPKQWVKNGFVLLPIFFGGRLLDLPCLLDGFVAFFSFSFMASAVYCLNDLKDIEADRTHPKKCKRPLAAGKLKPVHAIVLMVFLILASLLTGFLLSGNAGWKVVSVVSVYLILNIAYCLQLKKYSIIDVFIVSFGFVLRLFAGSFACNIPLSPWIVLMTFLLALFLAFAKRRDDVVIYEKNKIIVRRNVRRYNLDFLNQSLGLIGAITIVCYVMYCVSPDVTTRFDNNYVYVTSIFVMAAILRYLQAAIVDARTGSPTKVILRDRFIQSCVVLWLLSFCIILYL